MPCLNKYKLHVWIISKSLTTKKLLQEPCTRVILLSNDNASLDLSLVVTPLSTLLGVQSTLTATYRYRRYRKQSRRVEAFQSYAYSGSTRQHGCRILEAICTGWQWHRKDLIIFVSQRILIIKKPFRGSTCSPIFIH